MKVSIVMTKQRKKKCSISKTFFKLTCPNLTMKRPKRPNSTKTENRSKTLKNTKRLKIVWE